FSLPEQAVIDENAGELVADRLVDEHRGHRRIDAARKPADDASVADLLADALDGRLAESVHGPVAAAAGDLADEIGEDLRAPRRVHDLRVELQAIETALLIGDRGKGRVGGEGDHLEPGRYALDAVAMA